MKTSFGFLAFALTGSQAAYSGDIVQYWVEQTANLVNGTVIGGLQSPPSAWGPAIVHGAIYLAATKAQSGSLAYQQLAVSHAAHNSLIWWFHGTRNYAATSAALKTILSSIGLAANSTEGSAAVKIGQDAARTAITARAGDKINDFVDYTYAPSSPGVYQAIVGGAPLPDTPQARFVTLFANTGDVSQFKTADPPGTTDPGYEELLEYVTVQGDRNSTVRTKFNTDTAYFWRENSLILWPRIANAVIGNSLATNVTKSAKFYAQLHYALANAGVAGWAIKYKYNAWRPVTALRYNATVWLPSGHDVSNQTWLPLLHPTPSHPDYVSTHATFGGAASQVIRSFLGTDHINVTVSSNVTIDNVGVITRHYTNLTYTATENGDSRVFGGIHFPFASAAGIKLGTEVALATLKSFDLNWDRF
ncbi:acid phosphatase/Vanadium-dependent haloperoxidase [Lindgomyces ingoldianus]|uniref:Acid phosphatase/Vanadium-dependent haloperoxidase n=1 Tax=Lindgomyces ingoldianus TaxID=673940 RepID=A0ACB6R6P0_9PLEO|nr:acid phosphatase/Vanadium-dependent haloperoxidase [Lindgomyces ingoldianus]KAF2474964.1 acid phosphatase/Vanadium-dependent haloperoxidase [Lindgomyces ingoldianus]